MKKFTFILLSLFAISMSAFAQMEKPYMCVVLNETQRVFNDELSDYEEFPADYYCAIVYSDRISFERKSGIVHTTFYYSYKNVTAKSAFYLSDTNESVMISFEKKILYCKFDGKKVFLDIDLKKTLKMAKELGLIE